MPFSTPSSLLWRVETGSNCAASATFRSGVVLPGLDATRARESLFQLKKNLCRISKPAKRFVGVLIPPKREPVRRVMPFRHPTFSGAVHLGLWSVQDD